MSLRAVRWWALMLFASGVLAGNPIINSTLRTETTSNQPLITPPPQLEPSLASCWSSWNDWRNYSSYIYKRETVGYTLNSSISSRFTSSSISIPMTTLCDGWPRALAPDTISEFYVTTVFPNVSETTYSWKYSSLPYTIPTPTCTIADGSEQCTSMWDVWSTISTAFPSETTYYVQPPCNTRPEGPHCPSPGSERRCVVDEVGPVSLLYWPITTVSGDFCSQNGSTVTPTPTAKDGSPNTVVYEGVTLTSPSAYVIMDAAALYSSKHSLRTWNWCGPTHTRLTLELDPTDVSSIKYPTGRIRRGEYVSYFSFNWADLNTVPYDAYSRRNPYKNQRSYIHFGYTPAIAVPAEITRSDPEWAGCTGNGILNPTLIPLGSTAQVTSTPPAPTASMVISSMPSVTESPEGY